MPLNLIFLVAAACSIGCGAQQHEEVSRQDSAAASPPFSTDPAAQLAREALAQGRPWQATRLLAPALRDSARRTPALVLLAATAAGEWEGWGEVQRLLEGEPWLDSLFDARGRELLARAALHRGDGAAARVNAEAAVMRAPTQQSRGVRLTLLARALDRLEQRDSSGSAYARAAELLPQASDWLRLRAAGVTADSARRAALYERVRAPAARERVGITEARVRERVGDLGGAARAYAAIGEPVHELRLRLATARTADERAAIRGELLSVVRERAGTAAARQAVEVLDSGFGRLSPAEELLVARSAARAGPLSRAATAFSRALAAEQGSAQDRFTYGTVLFRLSRYPQAAAQFARVRAPRPLAAEAAYQRARALLRGRDISAARTALRRVLRDFPRETGPASAALLLLADLATDEGRDADARAAFRDLARQYPGSSSADDARFRAALIAYVDGSHRQAALELDTLLARYPSSEEARAAAYWSGRAWAAAGDSGRARARWRTLVQDEPLSYYGGLAARRLGQQPWAPPPAPDSFPAVPAVDSAIARAALLERLGMDFEARLEYERLASTAGSDDRLLATANALRIRGLTSRGITLAVRALRDTALRDARVYRLMYPVVHREVLAAEAERHRLDPALVAALIRQESSFMPRATSPAGARGLMQVMPSVGAQVARGLGFPLWDPVLLYQPDVNVEIGTAHLRALVSQYSEMEHVLAAYNAGGSRVARWRQKGGAADPEVFTERIPFTETRDYVRIVLRNRDLYRALYPW